MVPHKAGVPWVYRYRRRLKMSGVSFKLGCMDVSCVRIEGRTTCSVMRGSSSHASFRTASSFIDCVAAVAFTQVSTASRRVFASRATHVPSKSTRYQVPRIDLRGRSLGDVAQGERIPSSLPSRVVHIGE